MKTIYFKHVGGFYYPIHAIGWLATLTAAAICVWFFIALDRHSHSASDTLTRFFVYATCVAFWWKWLAESTSERQ